MKSLQHLTRPLFVLTACLALFALIATGTPTARAAATTGGVITVNYFGDNNLKGTALTLREAILISNGGTSPVGLNRTLGDGEKAQLSGCAFSGSANNWQIIDGCGLGKFDTIKFNLPGQGVQSIELTETLPNISDPVMIDAYTQPGASPNTLTKGNNAAPKVHLNFKIGAHDMPAFKITGGWSTIRGFIINGVKPVYASPAMIVIEQNGNNVIQGNFIGTNLLGTAAAESAPLRPEGILINSSNNLIGGTSPAARNLISGNRFGIYLYDTTANGNIIQGNYIGTDKSGTIAIHNAVAIEIEGGSSTLIGGKTKGAGNLVSGNEYGIRFDSDSVANTQVFGNWIGLDASGKHALGNTQSGIVANGVHNIIGGNGKRANRIAYNGLEAVRVYGSGILVSRNLIYSNVVNIDLKGDGASENDIGIPADEDDGPNHMQNYPIIMKATAATRQLKVYLNSAANQTFTIEFFSGGACDANGIGQAKKFLGSTKLQTNSSFDGVKTVTLSKPFKKGQAITATATDAFGNTSEFSRCKTAK